MKAPGRKAFKGMGPPGVRLRMMEPGEAEALRGLLHAPPEATRFVRFLVSREVFVAEDKASGERLGFAAAVAASDVYWLSHLAVAPAARGLGVGSGLLAAVTQRARWFFHRALATGADVDKGAAARFYRNRGFLQVSPKDSQAILLDHLAEDAAALEQAEAGGVLVKWL